MFQPQGESVTGSGNCECRVGSDVDTLGGATSGWLQLWVAHHADCDLK